MTFAQQLRTERKRLKLTQPETAAILGVNAKTYWQYEAEVRTPFGITQEGALARLKKLKNK